MSGFSTSSVFTTPLLVQGATISHCATACIIIGFNGAGQNKLNDTTPSEDVIIGGNAGVLIPAGVNTFHTFVGSLAGAACSAGAGGVAIGQKSINTATTIQSSVAVGGKAGASCATVQDDTFVGYGSAQFATNTPVLGGRCFFGYNSGSFDGGEMNIAIGYNAGSTQQNPNSGGPNIGIGPFTLNNLKSTAANNGIQNIAIGYEALKNIVTSTSNVVIGHQAGKNTTGSLNTFIGSNAGNVNTTGSRNIYLGPSGGNGAPNNSTNFFIAGADSNDYISDVWFGKGYASTAATTNGAYTIHGTGGSGSNNPGADVSIAGGQGTGTAIGGDVALKYAPAGSTGSSFNALVDGLRIKPTGSIVLGNAALATNATDGFLYIPTCAGTPTGVPTTFTGRVPLIYDTTNDKFYIYRGGWKGGTTPGAFV